MPRAGAIASGTASASLHRRELDEPHAVRELIGKPSADRQREPGLPDAPTPVSVTSWLGADQRGHLRLTACERPTRVVAERGRLPRPA